jgi:hypothetical protein
MYLPEKWAFRIRRQAVGDDFPPCRNGRVESNVIVFKPSRYEGGVNVGPGTAPQTFRFAGNAWYCVDDSARSAPTLPPNEADGVVGKDPLFADPAKKDFSLRAGSPAAGKGHTGLKSK